MKIDSRILAALDQIRFYDRYKVLCQEFSNDTNLAFNFSKDIVLEIFKKSGYSFKYNKNESFYKLKENIGPFSFQFNIALGHGVVELIWDVKKGDERLEFGWGPWGTVSDILNPNEKLKNPVFRNYDDLTSILHKALIIYHDFKMSMIRNDQIADS